MDKRLIRLSLFALVLATLACSQLGSPTATPPPTAPPTLASAGQTPGGPTPPATRTAAPTGATAAGPTQPAVVGGPITATVAGPGPVGANLSSTGKAETARLAFDAAGTLHLVWFDKSAREAGDYFHRQKPGGGDWSKAENLTSDFDVLYGDISLITDQGGHVCAIFAASKSSSDPVTLGLYQRCQAGDKWGAANKLAITQQTGVTLRGYSPARGTDGTVHAAYIISAGTINFDDLVLSADSATALGPSLAIDKAGGYHVTWGNLGSATNPSTVQYRFSADQGKTWQDAQTLSTDKTAPGGGVTNLVSDSVGNVHLLWEGADSGTYYRRWTPAGGWGPATGVAGDLGGPNPALAVDTKGLARVVWERHDGLPYVVQAADGTWSAPRAISQLESAEPQIAIDAAGVTHVAWLSNKDVYYLVVP